MKNIKLYTLSLAASFMIFSCNTEDELVEERLSDPTIEIPTESGDPGSLDLSTFVSLGASITAGTADAALYTAGQDQSFPALLARQFAIEGVGGGDFNQPDIESENGYSGADAEGNIFGKLILDLGLSDGETGPSIEKSIGELPGPFLGDKAALNNFGVPGIQSGQILTPLTGGPAVAENPAYNALYARFASSPGTSTILGDAMARNPTFWSLFPAGNDVLGYAVSGGTNEAILTDPATVDGYVNAIVNTLLSNGSKGIIVTIPNLTVLPFFQAVPREIEVPEANREALLAGLGQINAAIAGWNAAVPESLQRPVLSTDMDSYPLIIEDASLSDAAIPLPDGSTFVIPKIRNIIPLGHPAFGVSELIILSASPFVSSGAMGISPLAPLTDEFVLDFGEIQNILVNTQAINMNIGATAVANAGKIAVMETFSFVTDVALGGGYSSPETGGYMLTPDFTPNGMYSNDGIHLNPRGAAVLANEMINILNKPAAEGGFGADIPKMYIMAFDPSPFKP